MFSRSTRFGSSRNSPNSGGSNNNKIIKNVDKTKVRSVHTKDIQGSLDSLVSKQSSEPRDSPWARKRGIPRREEIKSPIRNVRESPRKETKESPRRENRESPRIVGFRKKENVINSKKCLDHESTNQNPMNRFLISTERRTIKHNALNKIAKGVKNTLKETITGNVFKRNSYNVRKAEQKQNIAEKPDLNATFVLDSYEPEKLLNEIVDEDQKEDDVSTEAELDFEEAVKDMENVVMRTNSAINKFLQESLMKIKENSNMRFKSFLTEMIAYSAITLEQVQRQCENSIEDMNDKVRDILKNNTQRLAARDKELRRINFDLSVKLGECRSSSNNSKRRYNSMLHSAKNRISEQEKLVEALKAEIDSMDMNISLKKILSKQKKK